MDLAGVTAWKLFLLYGPRLPDFRRGTNGVLVGDSEAE